MSDLHPCTGCRYHNGSPVCDRGLVVARASHKRCYTKTKAAPKSPATANGGLFDD